MKIAVAAVLGLLALNACSSHGSSTPASSASSTPRSATTSTLSPVQIAANAQAKHEVTITSCGPNRAHHVEIKGTAHNTTSGPATYAIQLTIKDTAGKRLYATAASVSNVPSKHNGVWDAATTATYVAGMTCSVTSVSRARVVTIRRRARLHPWR